MKVTKEHILENSKIESGSTTHPFSSAEENWIRLEYEFKFSFCDEAFNISCYLSSVEHDYQQLVDKAVSSIKGGIEATLEELGVKPDKESLPAIKKVEDWSL